MSDRPLVTGAQRISAPSTAPKGTSSRYLSFAHFTNDGREAFLVLSSAYYDWTCLWSAVDFEQNIHFCLARRRSFTPTPADARADLHCTHFLAHFNPLFFEKIL